MVDLADAQPFGVAAASDEELMLRYRDRGDQEAFHALVHRYERELYNYLCRYLSDAELAEEVFQATFFRVHESKHLFEEGKPLRPWLYTIATHQAIDALRRAGKHPSISLEQPQATDGNVGPENDGSLLDMLAAETPPPPIQAENAESRAWLREAVNRLPEQLRSVVLLVFFQGLKYSEAAEILGVHPATVKSRLSLAIAKLNAAWRQSQAA